MNQGGTADILYMFALDSYFSVRGVLFLAELEVIICFFSQNDGAFLRVIKE